MAASEPLKLADLVPAKVQKAVVHDDGSLILELFAGRKCFFVVAQGAIRIDVDKVARTDIGAPPTDQAVLRKEAVPSILSAIDVDAVTGLVRLHLTPKEGPSRVLVVEQDAGDPRWLLLARTGDGDRVLCASGARQPRDGRDLRRGRLYEAPRLAPQAAGAPATTRTAPVHVDPQTAALRGALRGEARRLQRLITALEGDLRKHGDASLHEAAGELLKTGLRQIKRGMTSIELLGFHGAPEVVTLDPRLDGKGNLDRAFRLKKKAQEAADRAAPRLADARSALAAVEAVRAALCLEPPEASTLAAAEAVLSARGAGGSARRQAAKAGPRQAWRCFRCSGDVIIRVGRSARDNEALVKSARGNDLWLHARDQKGSHVIIPSAGGPILDELLLDAALLAAWFSAGRGESRLQIQHTRVKNLKKPGGKAAPGLFLVSNESVLPLRIDAERQKRLLDAEVPAS